MKSPYDIITISFRDLEAFEANDRGCKVWIILKLVLEELPSKLKSRAGFISPILTPIHGFKDDKVQGLEITIRENRKIESFVREFVPFFILIRE
ncbi:MAG: hypothetical protein PHS44_07795 [Candidatus Dojkabacteria bacterium]|jgi:hypothetical protein|nr:hypothetical protein [Candidatus Dojkabacteria bacterium]